MQTNILVVEDDLTTQEMARMVLENAGYGVSVARSAEDAERVLLHSWPDIVLMDRDLPGMDGLAFTRRLKANEDTQGITVIAFSSNHSSIDNAQALAAGSDGFVHKPFTVRGLLQTVAWHVAARAAVASSTERSAVADRPEPDDAVWHTSAVSSRLAGATANLLGGFMNASRKMIISGLLVMAAAASAQAQTATQTVTFQVDAINQIAVSGTPTLTISTATAGGAPATATSTGSTWAITTNQTGAKVTASIGTALPAGVTLSAELAAPGAGGTSAGEVALGTAPVDVVTGLTKLNASGLALTYRLSATTAAGTVASTTRVVTYTITGGA